MCGPGLRDLDFCRRFVTGKYARGDEMPKNNQKKIPLLPHPMRSSSCVMVMDLSAAGAGMPSVFSLSTRDKFTGRHRVECPDSSDGLITFVRECEMSSVRRAGCSTTSRISDASRIMFVSRTLQCAHTNAGTGSAALEGLRAKRGPPLPWTEPPSTMMFKE